MTLEEFEAYYRNSMDEILNELQGVNLLTMQMQMSMSRLENSEAQVRSISTLTLGIEARVMQMGSSVQQLSLVVEEFIQEQRTQ